MKAANEHSPEENQLQIVEIIVKLSMHWDAAAINI